MALRTIIWLCRCLGNLSSGDSPAPHFKRGRCQEKFVHSSPYGKQNLLGTASWRFCPPFGIYMDLDSKEGAMQTKFVHSSPHWKREGEESNYRGTKSLPNLGFFEWFIVGMCMLFLLKFLFSQWATVLRL